MSWLDEPNVPYELRRLGEDLDCFGYDDVNEDLEVARAVARCISEAVLTLILT